MTFKKSRKQRIQIVKRSVFYLDLGRIKLKTIYLSSLYTCLNINSQRRKRIKGQLSTAVIFSVTYIFVDKEFSLLSELCSGSSEARLIA